MVRFQEKGAHLEENSFSVLAIGTTHILGTRQSGIWCNILQHLRALIGAVKHLVPVHTIVVRHLLLNPQETIACHSETLKRVLSWNWQANSPDDRNSGKRRAKPSYPDPPADTKYCYCHTQNNHFVINVREQKKNWPARKVRMKNWRWDCSPLSAEFHGTHGDGFGDGLRCSKSGCAQSICVAELSAEELQSCSDGSCLERFRVLDRMHRPYIGIVYTSPIRFWMRSTAQYIHVRQVKEF